MATLLFVHAHPDDETLATGVAMAHHALAGDDVHVLTCTLGEEGEVIPPGLRHLAADREDRLGTHRREELRRAMAALGVSHRVLGEAGGEPQVQGGTYRDSGMAGTPGAEHRCAFVNADPDEAAALVAAELLSVRPDVVVTYERTGGYRHPDHVQAHRVTVTALRSLAARGEVTPPLLGVVVPRSWAVQDRAWLQDHVDRSAHPWLVVPGDGAEWRSGVVPDDLVDATVADGRAGRRQLAALLEHATQVSVIDDHVFALSNSLAARLSGREAYARLDPATGAFLPAAGLAAAEGRGLLDLAALPTPVGA